MTLQTGKLKINGVDIATEVNQKVNSSALAKVATSGSYIDLKDKPKFLSFKGATSSTNGTSGLVPQPNKGDNQKWLSGDGTWKLGTQLEVTVEKISKTATSPQSYSLGNYTAIIVFVNSVLAVDGDSYGIVGTNKLVFNDILPIGTEVVIYKFITLGSVLPSSNIAVDSALSATSTATVQNKAIYNAMQQLKADKSALTAITEFMNSYQSQLDAIYAKYEAELS